MKNIVTPRPAPSAQRPAPKFSIITVTYNAEKVLEGTIKSVITQTYQNIEYIIVDGASKDKTPAIIEKYRQYIHILVSEPDKGLYDAMNKGMALATGDYLCFLNAGDHLHAEDTLLQMVQSINSEELPDVLYGETAIVDQQRNFIIMGHKLMHHSTIPEKLNGKSFEKGMMVNHQAFFAKRSLSVPYDLRYSVAADTDGCIRVMKKSKTLHNTNLTIIDYLEGGFSAANYRTAGKERFYIMITHYGGFSTARQHAYYVFRLLTRPARKLATKIISRVL